MLMVEGKVRNIRRSRRKETSGRQGSKKQEEGLGEKRHHVGRQGKEETGRSLGGKMQEKGK